MKLPAFFMEIESVGREPVCFFLRKGNIQRFPVFQHPFRAGGTDSREQIHSLRESPAQRQLGNSAAFVSGEFADTFQTDKIFFTPERLNKRRTERGICLFKIFCIPSAREKSL